MDEPLRRSNAEESPAIDTLPEVLGDLDESLSVTVQANCDETSDSWNTIRIVFRFFRRVLTPKLQLKTVLACLLSRVNPFQYLSNFKIQHSLLMGQSTL